MTSAGTKVLNRCPRCDTTRISDRATVLPRYRCMKCGHAFEVARADVVDVVRYQARYDAAWTSLDGLLDGPEIRSLTVHPREFNAMRPLDWPRFHEALVARGARRAADRVAARVDLSWGPPGVRIQIPQGFGHALVRVRRGQRQFREHLLASQGNMCAFTGDAPARVLEAGHLYSYAQLGTHDEHGGLMLRRDIHRLFDDGALAVDPSDLRVDVAPDLAAYPQYARLHDEPLTVHLRDRQVDWLARHWDEHRGAPDLIGA